MTKRKRLTSDILLHFTEDDVRKASDADASAEEEAIRELRDEERLAVEEAVDVVRDFLKPKKLSAPEVHQIGGIWHELVPHGVGSAESRVPIPRAQQEVLLERAQQIKDALDRVTSADDTDSEDALHWSKTYSRDLVEYIRHHARRPPHRPTGSGVDKQRIVAVYHELQKPPLSLRSTRAANLTSRWFGQYGPTVDGESIKKYARSS